MADLRHRPLARRALLAAPALLPFLAAPGCAAAPSAVSRPGEARITESRTVWRDAARARDIPVLIREPAGSGPAPTVFISHGLGGSREGLAYLGRALAENGYLAIHLQHIGSDDSLWRGGGDRMVGLAAGALNVQAALDRLLDVKFALDNLPRRADPERLAVAGHSFGAWTVQHMLGERLPGGDRGLGLPDPRLKAGVALSPIPAIGLPPRLAYGGFAVPMLHITGTEDHGFIEGIRAPARRAPFEQSTNPGALVVLAGALHASFADEQEAGGRYAESTYHARAASLSVTFLDAVLRGDAADRAVLRNGATGLLGPGDTFVSRGL
ncbi:acetylhydrolase [Roseomonas sp. SSH11]|uniref:Acetylhydrolase n=1 Tax=Pararoseomonas baculiformis TaxID=2820812 RepID=A0ABS4A9V2_9PROT|nr:acetylhydrolase [Pararoseomonas baculiformis]